MGAELSRTFDLNAAALGNLSAFYFYSYVAMQIPTGYLADTLGPRRLLTAGAVVAAGGTILFALAPSNIAASLGRLLVGGSVAVAFIGMLKLAGHWFPHRMYALASGIALFAGIGGAIFAGVPLQAGVSMFGWRAIMLAGGALVLVIGILIYLVVRDDPTERGYASHAAENPEAEASAPRLAASLRRVITQRNTLLLAIVPAGIVGPLMTFAGLWGQPFLTTHHGFSETGAAAANTALLVSWAIGGPLFGWLSDRVGRRRSPYISGVWVALAGWIVVIYVPGLPHSFLVGTLIVIGFFCGSMVLGFAFAKESVPARYSGTASGVVNMGVMSGPMVLQPVVGWVLDRNWTGEQADGLRIFDLAAYQSAFALMLAWLALSAILILFTRETRCRAMK
ncbi:MAG: MFS transporter [Proteobacteria bacterium]|nr:MAG: MFS transporter [Pseudomonadota bacterium]